jgi:hypothetical protein
VLWICNVLIRIRIRYAVPLNYGSNPDPALFGFRDAKKLIFIVFLLMIYQFQKILSFLKVKKITVEIRLMCLLTEGSGFIHSNGSGSERPKHLRVLWNQIRNTANS